jgi:hypothetical protein
MKKKELALQDPESTTCRRKTTIGGQALIEGLLMIGPEKKAMAVRLPDGSISVEAMPMVQFSGMANWRLCAAASPFPPAGQRDQGPAAVG